MSVRLVDNPNLNGQVTAPDASYPDGSYLDDSTGTSGDGTPIEKSQKDDLEGLLQGLRLNSDIVASGNPDTALVSDYLDAFRRLTIFPYVATLDYRVGDMARGSDGLTYRVLVINGPATTIVDPVFDIQGFWIMGAAKQKAGSNLLYGGYGLVNQRGPLGNVGNVANEYTLDGIQLRTLGGSPARFNTSKGGNIPGQSGSALFDIQTISPTMGAGRLTVIRIPIEAQDLQILETGTVGVKKLGIRLIIRFPKSGIQPISIYNEDDNTSFPTEINVTTPAVFQEFTFDIPGNSAGVIDNDSGAGLWLCIPLLAGTNFQGTLDQWQSGEKYATANQQNQVSSSGQIEFVAKMEVGTSTPFDIISAGDALRWARRYYEAQIYTDGDWMPVFLPYAATIALRASFPMSHKRVIPIGGITNSGWNINLIGPGSVTSILAHDPTMTQDAFAVSIAGSSFVNGSSWSRPSASTTTKITMNAEM